MKAVKAMIRLLMAMEGEPPVACNSFNEANEFLLTGIMAVGQIIRFLPQAAHRSHPAHMEELQASVLPWLCLQGWSLWCQVFEQLAGDSPSSSLQ